MPRLENIMILVTSTLNIFWMEISIFLSLHWSSCILRSTVIPCLKLTEILRMEEIPCKRRFPLFLYESF